MKIDEVKKLLSSKYYNSDKLDLLYVDFNEKEIKTFTKVGKIDNDMVDDYSDEYYNSVNKLSKVNKTFEINSNDSKEKIITKINLASNQIAVDGRIGLGDVLLISKNNFNKISEIKGYNIYFINDDDKIIIYRKTDFDQPGLSFVFTDDKYSFIEKGFYPEKQFIKIEVK